MTPTASSTPTPMLRRAGLSVALFAFAMVASWFRLPAASRGLLWAEDGMFLSQALARPQDVALLFAPYAGYLHVVPRLIAGLVAGLSPVSAYPVWVTLASLAVSSGIAVLIFFLARGQGFSAPASLALYGLTFLAPAVPTEVLGNLANLHWFFLWLAPWLFVSRPKSRAAAIALAAVATLAALTEVMVLLFVPLLLWRPRRDHRWWMLAGAFGLAWQVATAMLSPRSRDPFDISVHSVAVIGEGFVAEVGAAIWRTHIPPVTFIGTVGWPALTALVFAIPAASAIWIALRGRSHRLLAAWMLLAAGAVWVLSAVVNNFPDWPPLLPLSQLSSTTPTRILRHAIAPAWMLASVIVIAADQLRQRFTGRRQFIAFTGVFALVIAWGIAYPDRDQTLRVFPTSWAQEVATATSACAAGTSSPIRLPVPPGATWGVQVTCAQLQR